MKTFALAALAAVLTTTAAHAQDACISWNQQVQVSDRGLMQRIAGTWATQEPNGMGGVYDVTVTYAPDGTVTLDRRTCISMEAQGLGTSCPTSSAWGAWVAHYADQNGGFFLATNMRQSTTNGQVVQGCGGVQGYLADPSTMVGPNGQVIARRVR